MSVLCLTSSFYFSKPYWTGSQFGETNLFLQFWIYLIYVIFVFDMYTTVYSQCTWVSLSFDINKSLLLIKKKKIFFFFLSPLSLILIRKETMLLQYLNWESQMNFAMIFRWNILNVKQTFTHVRVRYLEYLGHTILLLSKQY